MDAYLQETLPCTVKSHKKIEQVMYGHYLIEQEIIANYYQGQTIGDILNQIREVEA